MANSVHREGRRFSHSRGTFVPVALLTAFAFGACSFTVYALWPTWPKPQEYSDIPALPITVAGTAFNVPPAAFRVPMQRQPGAHERVDLAFVWPTLEPPESAFNSAVPANSVGLAANSLPNSNRVPDRIFVMIAAAGETLSPQERVKTIYPRYAANEATAGLDGLAVLPFREGTPYQGEDLIYDPKMPEGFLVRCTRDGAGATRGVCLLNERIEAADIIVRFPRDWLRDWRFVAKNVDTLLQSLRPHVDE
jgi:hypothetical protein